jgi:hypothetical protein
MAGEEAAQPDAVDVFEVGGPKHRFIDRLIDGDSLPPVKLAAIAALAVFATAAAAIEASRSIVESLEDRR